MYYLGRVCRGSPAPPTGHGEKGASELELCKQGEGKTMSSKINELA